MILLKQATIFESNTPLYFLERDGKIASFDEVIAFNCLDNMCKAIGNTGYMFVKYDWELKFRWVEVIHEVECVMEFKNIYPEYFI